LYETALSLGLEVLMESHSDEDLETAIEFPRAILGINNRDLSTLVTDLSVGRSLAGRIPPGRPAVIESGIRTPEDVWMFWKLGYAGFLIGEVLMRSARPDLLLCGLAGPEEPSGVIPKAADAPRGSGRVLVKICGLTSLGTLRRPGLKPASSDLSIQWFARCTPEFACGMSMSGFQQALSRRRLCQRDRAEILGSRRLRLYAVSFMKGIPGEFADMPVHVWGGLVSPRKPSPRPDSGPPTDI
jgi:hypothetical protein